jgi:CheY-like chemotaxis protein
MKKILVVDNDPIMLHTFVGLLKSQGGFLQILSAPSIQAAMEILAGQEIHILITGMHMSEMDAFELASLLEAKYPTDPRHRHDQQRLIHVPGQDQADALGHSLRSGPGHQHAHQADFHRIADRLRRTDSRGSRSHHFSRCWNWRAAPAPCLSPPKGKWEPSSSWTAKPAWRPRWGCLTGKSAALHILTWENVLIDIDYAPRDETAGDHHIA